MALVEERLARMEERVYERMEEKIEKRVEERVSERLARMEERMEEKIKKKEEEMISKFGEKEAVLRKELEDREEVLRNELKEEMEEKEEVLRKETKKIEAMLRKEMGSKKVAGAVTKGLHDLPYLALCANKETTTTGGTITFDSFLTNFNTANNPGGADGQLDLGTGVFTCLSEGIYRYTLSTSDNTCICGVSATNTIVREPGLIYRIDFSGIVFLDPAEEVGVSVFLNGDWVPQGDWGATARSGAIGGQLIVTMSRSLVSVHLPIPFPTMAMGATIYWYFLFYVIAPQN